MLLIYLQNIFYKTFFATNFVGNTCKFYKFVGINYPRRNYQPIKILRENDRKKSFLVNFFNKFARKIPCNMRISNSDTCYPQVSTMGHNSGDEEIEPNPSEVEDTIGKYKPKLKINPSRNCQASLKFKDCKMN